MAPALSLIVTAIVAAVTTCTVIWRVSAPAPQVAVAPPKASPVRDCRHLYNQGRSVEWQVCMGVGPK